MKSMRRILLLGLLAAVVFALPLTVLANKRIFLATLTTEAELHEVVDSDARGSGFIGSTPNSGFRFGLQVHNLSGDAVAVHIHGPATPEENGPVVVTLCGAPPPAILPQCTMQDGVLVISGTITTQLQGMTPQQFVQALDGGLLYFNVHTQLNPAGEVRGQIIPR
jgi:hypothetical protein